MQVFATSPAAIYTGIGNAFTRISSTEGIRALWRGVSSVILGAGPAHAVHFGAYEAVKELAGGNEKGNQWVATCEWAVLCRSLLVLQAPTVLGHGALRGSPADVRVAALAGASATVASDALMNPFDGQFLATLILNSAHQLKGVRSHQAKNASTQV
jgi:hypothetical protein